jgi:hypothetical protein
MVFPLRHVTAFRIRAGLTRPDRTLDDERWKEIVGAALRRPLAGLKKLPVFGSGLSGLAKRGL